MIKLVKSTEQRRILLVSIIMMTIVSLLVLVITIWTLYRASFNEHANQLVAMVDSQARLIESVARFDIQYSADDHQGGARAATLAGISSFSFSTTSVRML